MRILHISESIAGGIETYLRELAFAQVDQFGPGNIHLLIPSSQGQNLARNRGLVVHGFRHGGSRLLAALTLMAKTWKLLKRLRPDVVHVHSTFAGISVRTCAWMTANRPPIVYCAHGWAFLRETSRWKQWGAAMLERLLAHQCDLIINISNTEHRAAIRAGLPQQKCRVIRNGLSEARLPLRPGLAEDTTRMNFLFVGRHDRQKGLELAVEAFRMLPAERFRLYVAGAPVLHDSRNLTGACPDSVKFVGWVPHDQLDAYIQSVDAVIVPSRWEGFGLVVLEAMRNGRAVIASNRGALPELVLDGSTGLIFEPYDAAALRDLLREVSRDSLARMGGEGLKRFRAEFHVSRMIAETASAYRVAIQAHGRN